MAQTTGRHERGLLREVQRIVRRGFQTWRLVPGAQRLALGGAVLVMAVSSLRRGGPGGPPRGGCQAVRARVAARAMASMASAGLAASVTWQSVYLQMAA